MHHTNIEIPTSDEAVNVRNAVLFVKFPRLR